MIKELKALPLLMASVLLAACGSATDATSGNDDSPVDLTPPKIESIDPNIVLSKEGSNIIDISTDQLVFTFDEPLDPSSISKLDTVSFITSTGQALNGTWNFDGSTKLTFIFDFDSLSTGTSNTLPRDETFTLNFNKTIEDLAGNGINFLVQFKTPQVYDIEVSTSGLPANTSIQIRVQDNTNANNITTESITSNGSTIIDASLTTNSSFKLSIDTQPDDDTFCTFNSTTGAINENNAPAQLNCSNVVPYIASAPNWNTYSAQTDINGDPLPLLPLVHRGEQRKFTMSNLSNCDDLTIVDDLNAFDWSCEVDLSGTPKAVIFSTKLKDGAYLSDLLNFSRTTPKWKSNSVSVKQGNSAELNQNKIAAIWWHNPISVPSNSTLSSEETIYIIPDNELDLNRSYSLSGRHAALVVKPGISIKSSQANAAILINETGIWLEGTIDANNSSSGVLVNSGYYTQIRNFNVTNAASDGILLFNSELTYLIDSSSSLNRGNGVAISGNTTRNVNIIHGNIGKNIVLNENTKNGLFIDNNSFQNKMSNISASGNDENGISVSKLNAISNSYANQNINNGIVINGHNNTITMLTAIENGENGVLLTNASSSAAPKNNFLSSITTTNIAVESSVEVSNTEININDVAEENVNPLPLIFSSHTFVGDDIATYLEDAVEIVNDNSGNDNGLCEADETCIYTPNSGHEQGIGSLIVVEDDNNIWTGSNIVLKQYDNIIN